MQNENVTKHPEATCKGVHPKATNQTELDKRMEEVGKAMWTLRSITETLESIVLPNATPDMGRNLQLAVEHLQDARHRLERVEYEYDKLT
jgi:hypothetical protein